MRITLGGALFGIALVALTALHAQDGRPSSSAERAFVANGRIRMDLSAGEYRISASKDNRIRLHWSVEDADQLGRVRTRIDVRNTEATINVDSGSRNNNFKVDVQVPARTDLYVRLTAGELTLEDIEGNKDVEAHAGEIRIDVVRPEDYRSVDSSLWAGEINAAPFHLSKDGLFRSISWNGNGPYRLHARLKAGEIHLYSK